MPCGPLPYLMHISRRVPYRHLSRVADVLRYGVSRLCHHDKMHMIAAKLRLDLDAEIPLKSIRAADMHVCNRAVYRIAPPALLRLALQRVKDIFDVSLHLLKALFVAVSGLAERDPENFLLPLHQNHVPRTVS